MKRSQCEKSSRSLKNFRVSPGDEKYQCYLLQLLHIHIFLDWNCRFADCFTCLKKLFSQKYQQQVQKITNQKYTYSLSQKKISIQYDEKFHEIAARKYGKFTLIFTQVRKCRLHSCTCSKLFYLCRSLYLCSTVNLHFAQPFIKKRTKLYIFLHFQDMKFCSDY